MVEESAAPEAAFEIAESQKAEEGATTEESPAKTEACPHSLNNLIMLSSTSETCIADVAEAQDVAERAELVEKAVDEPVNAEEVAEVAPEPTMFAAEEVAEGAVVEESKVEAEAIPVVREEPSEPAVQAEEPVPDEVTESTAPVEAIIPGAAAEEQETPAAAMGDMSAPPVIAVTISDETAEASATEGEKELERPKSPWTPSYSVTTQGPGIPSVEPTALDKSAMVAQGEVASLAEAPIPEVSVEEVHAAPKDAVEPATERTWVPSYSISSQGTSPMHKPVELAEEVEPIEDLSVKETPAENAVVPPVEEFVPAEKEAASNAAAEPEMSVQTTEAAPEETVEPPKIVTPDEEPETEPQVVEEKVVPEERPPSRPWTPSYSVSRQGTAPSPVQAPTELESFPTEQPAEPVIITEEPEAAPADADATELPAERTWVRSYSVSRQGSRSSLVPEKESQTTAEVAEPPAAVAVAPEEPQQPSEAEEGLVKAGEDPERPWTPSYSVIRQGTSPHVESKELVASENDIATPAAQSPETAETAAAPVIAIEEAKAAEQTPASAAAIETEVPKASPVAERPPSPWTPSYSFNHQGSSPLNSPAVQPKDLEADVPAPSTPETSVEPEAVQQPELAAENLEAKPEQPERPWTPSYSVTTQGPASPLKEEPKATTDETKSEAFPTVETAEHGPKLTTNLARLAPSDEHQRDDSTADIDSPTTRPRHESVTSISSRAIPGGWVSGETKSPGENQASLETAAGEFSNNKNAAPAPTTKGKHQKKKSGKCVIM
ncbi:uncharacterized protein PHACADRAFT_252378 [Phanerochaete carnosa HHB-10118-sp]|uniref:Uncharacterized protein n=1 Tax=Phanerochaete carnosa (strain HHB-10118-sp) TaxID=650164 RepID=K5V691_PHACS|nr:uncharacterized protein PHACADRAFT_252378 [Phanerochaete carnosa HHB-10118-sp]EKM58221.1 hypothetical protein PHACADRAFT_252378 [Phanerochaete carnosa HHB-10118-sp]